MWRGVLDLTHEPKPHLAAKNLYTLPDVFPIKIHIIPCRALPCTCISQLRYIIPCTCPWEDRLPIVLPHTCDIYQGQPFQRQWNERHQKELFENLTSYSIERNWINRSFSRRLSIRKAYRDFFLDPSTYPITLAFSVVVQYGLCSKL